MKEVVRDAFLSVRGRAASDVVIADPDLNERFLRECQSRGLAQPPVELNLCLLNLRKGGWLKGVTSERTRVPNQSEFRFASEIAVRFLERRDSTSLDRVLCDPALATEFDRLAADIAPGYRRFQYRWAALNLRKKSRLRPEILARVVPAESVVTLRAADVKPEELPVRPGLYLFIDRNQVLYVGECQSIRNRIGKHLDHSDNKGLARWLWENERADLHLEYHVLPAEVTVRQRKALEAELIRSRNPIYNVAGVDRRGPRS
jgi:site-specific DNA-methyltransferase (adenine-specific)